MHLTSIEQFALFVASNQPTASLTVEINEEIGDAGAQALVLALQQARHLPHGFELNLAACEIDVDGARAFATLLQTAQHLPTGFKLDLSGNRLGNTGVQALITAVCNTRHLPRDLQLTLNITDMDDAGAQAIAIDLGAAEHLPKGFVLNIESNGLDNASAEAFATMLQQAQHLPIGFRLNLNQNHFDDDVVSTLSTALQHATHLPRGFQLNLGANEISAAGNLQILKDLQTAQHLPQEFELTLVLKKLDTVLEEELLNFLLIGTIPTGFKLIGCPNSVVQRLLEHLKTAIEYYQDSMDSDYAKDTAAFNNAIRSMQALQMIIKPNLTMPDWFRTEAQFLLDELPKRCRKLADMELTSYEALMTQLNDILRLILPTKNNPTLMNTLLLTLATTAGEFIPNAAESTPIDPNIVKLYAFELACHAKIMANDHTETSLIFTPLFVRFCHYLETGVSAYINILDIQKVGSYVNKNTGRPSSSIPKHDQAWRYILKEMLALFNPDTLTPLQNQSMIQKVGYLGKNTPISNVPILAPNGYDDCWIEQQEKKAIRRSSMSN